MSLNRILTLGVLLCAAVTVRAHHSFAVEFLEDQTDTIEGIVTEVWFKNPHIRYYIDTQTDGGEMESWDVRGLSPTSLIRRGWTPKTIQEGDSIKVHGHLGRDGRKLMSIIWIELADGTKLGQEY
ncbi:MAG: DUF6152 family protein [Woeseiaceae bacterium]